MDRTSERSERVLNSDTLMRMSDHLLRVTECNDRLHYGVILAIL